MARDYARSNKSSSRRSRDEEGGRNWRWPLAGILIALFAAGIFFLKQQSDKLAVEQGDQGGSIIQRTMKENVAEKTSSAASSKPSAKKSTTAGSISATQPTESPASPPPQPKFDFYTMLPQGQNAASSSNKNSTPATSAPAPAATPITPATPPAAKQTTAPVITPAPSHPSGNAESKHPSQKQLKQNAQADTSDLIAAEIQKLGTDNTSKSKADTNTAKTTSHYIVQLGVFKNYNDADQLKAQLVLQGYEVVIKSFKKQNTLYRVYMGPYPNLAAAKKQQHLLEQNQIKSKIAKE